MAKKKIHELDFVERMKALAKAGLKDSLPPNRDMDKKTDELLSLEERLGEIFEITEKRDRNIGNMLFFVMYDIENNKVRSLVSKYLIKNGCTRIQKSIFLADLPSEKYEQIRSDLTEVQEAYENFDSILVVPISTDYLKSMKIIGKNISVDVITKSKNTLFF